MRRVTFVVEDDEPVFLIRGRDILAPEAVQAYMNLCKVLCLDEQAGEVDKAIDEIVEWQEANPNLVKDPDHAHVNVGDM